MKDKGLKIGVFGGTFNPIHKGHVNAAREFLNELSLDKLIVIPTNIPPHKISNNMVKPSDRLTMCELAFRDDKKISVSDMEIKRQGLSYTVDTLKELAMRYENAELFLITGTDMFTTLDKWKNFEEISKLATLCGCARNEGEFSKVQNYAQYLKTTYSSKCCVLNIPVFEVSSTQIRQAIENGQDTKKYLDEKVQNYIDEHSFYKSNRNERSDLKLAGEFDSKIEFFKDILEKTLTPKRFYHTCCVSKEAEKLAKKYGADVEKARFAGLVHDITKDRTKEEQLSLVEKYSIILDDVEKFSPKLLHAITGAAMLKNEYNIEDEDIINAVRYHTTARAGMSLLEKIIYLADYVSADRDYEGVDELREKIYVSLQDGMEEALDFSICEVVDKKAPIHIDTVKARNELIINKTI